MFDQKTIKEKFGLKPEQLLDFKSLVGDASDNIPGIPGIGEKTAKKLIQDFESLENLYSFLDRVSPELREKLKKYKEQVFLSKSLLQIKREVPIDLEVENFSLERYNKEKVIKLLEELEFKSLIKRLPEFEKQKDREQKTLF